MLEKIQDWETFDTTDRTSTFGHQPSTPQPSTKPSTSFSDSPTAKQVVASRTCSNKKFCEEMKPDEKKCNAAKKIQEDCPVSCKKCNPCEDSEICTTLNNIKALCKYESKVRSICPKSCETCQYQDITLGIHVLKNL